MDSDASQIDLAPESRAITEKGQSAHLGGVQVDPTLKGRAVHFKVAVDSGASQIDLALESRATEKGQTAHLGGVQVDPTPKSRAVHFKVAVNSGAPEMDSPMEFPRVDVQTFPDVGSEKFNVPCDKTLFERHFAVNAQVATLDVCQNSRTFQPN